MTSWSTLFPWCRTTVWAIIPQDADSLPLPLSSCIAVALGHANTRTSSFKSSLHWYMSGITQSTKQPRTCSIVPSCFIFPSYYSIGKHAPHKEETNIRCGWVDGGIKITWDRFHAIRPQSPDITEGSPGNPQRKSICTQRLSVRICSAQCADGPIQLILCGYRRFCIYGWDQALTWLP